MVSDISISAVHIPARWRLGFNGATYNAGSGDVSRIRIAWRTGEKATQCVRCLSLVLWYSQENEQGGTKMKLVKILVAAAFAFKHYPIQGKLLIVCWGNRGGVD